MIQDTQEYLQHWEKENNPFYPSEMRWDRLQVNRFLKDYKQQLIIPVVGCQREQLSCETCKFLCEDWDEKHPCADCAGFEHWEAT